MTTNNKIAAEASDHQMNKTTAQFITGMTN